MPVVRVRVSEKRAGRVMRTEGLRSIPVDAMSEHDNLSLRVSLPVASTNPCTSKERKLARVLKVLAGEDHDSSWDTRLSDSDGLCVLRGVDQCVSAEVELRLVSELCHISPETLGEHRHLQGHAEADRCCRKSLIGSALGCFGVRQHARAETISKRAPPTTLKRPYG